MYEQTAGRVAHTKQHHSLEQKLKIKLSGRKRESKVLGQNGPRWIFSINITVKNTWPTTSFSVYFIHLAVPFEFCKMSAFCESNSRFKRPWNQEVLVLIVSVQLHTPKSAKVHHTKRQ